jgi:hypothetical protein
MSITASIPNQAKADLIGGLHLSSHTYKMALYPTTATLDATSTTYSSTGECANGNGYATGGATLAGYANALVGTSGRITWTSPQWSAATITARGAVIYNTSAANKIVAVLDFGADATSTNGTFTVNLPANASGGTIQFN